MKQAAIELYQRIKEFGIKPRTHLDHETALISKLVKDCETDFAVHVARLGLRPYVASLKEANLKVEKLIRSRIEANIGRVKGERRSARQASDEAYLVLIKTVNCLYFLELVPGMEPFVSYMNFMVKRYKEQVLTRKNRSTKFWMTTPLTIKMFLKTSPRIKTPRKIILYPRIRNRLPMLSLRITMSRLMMKPCLSTDIIIIRSMIKYQSLTWSTHHNP